ncbi:MAG TPA: oligosaccharyl transferase, archaeosortase A system-associated [Methanolinea sp.]|nr:oligosaccharyl transferase, archaeosortase A system-associated [Methanolinea sp.]
MDSPDFMRYRKYLIVILLAAMALFMIWIRMLPSAAAGTTDILNLVGSDDPMYNLRQVEQTIQNFPAYSWFEAMTLYPYGQVIHWGPLFIWIISALCLALGATTRPEIISVALVVPPVMAGLMVPVMFLLGKKVSGTMAGLFSALVIAVVSGQFFFRSLYGYLDHHIAEVLFSTIFILCYTWTLSYVREHPVDFSRRETLRIPLVLSVSCGVAYVLGLLVMPTMVLFAFIVAITTFLLFVWGFFRGVRGDSLLLLNSVTFGIAAASFLIFGVHKEGFQFDYYTLGHPLAYLLIILGTAVLYVLGRFFRERGQVQYLAGLAGLFVVVFGFFAVAIPGLFSTFVASIIQFFGQNQLYLTIQEARSWTIADAWDNFGLGLILLAAGLVLLCILLWKEKRDEHLVVLVWSLVIIIATWQHIRYEYYFAAPLALLSGLFVGWIVGWGWKDISLLLTAEKGENREGPVTDRPDAKQKGKKKAKQERAASRRDPLKIGAVAVVLLILCVFAYFQVSYELRVAGSGALRMNPDWRESLEWMEKNTPDPGVDYYRIYQKETFRYPPESYGVMSWWDYGHLITYIAKRIPNANPFQSGVAGENGAAAFFMTADEERNSEIAKALGVRYVMTDVEMDIGKFWAMATWFNTSAGLSPYTEVILVPGQGGTETYSPVEMYEAPYFVTMISRLHNFDGSMADAKQVYYVEVDESRTTYPVATKALAMDPQAALEAADAYNRDAAPGKRALVISPDIRIPVGKVPALRHYRLVHESPTNILAKAQANASPDLITDMRYVKVFEYVPGARIAGEGTIEVDVVTNTGREFTYRQESRDGTFIVPYATTGSPYEVRTKGKYRIVGTGREFEVPEEAVLQGLPVG